MSNAFINTPNFPVYRCDAGCRGGIGIYVCDTLKINEVFATTADVEDIRVNVQSNMLPSWFLRIF